MTTSLLNILSDRAKYQSEQQAYIFLQNGETESGSLTYGELDRQARAIAAKIQSWQGERALLMYPSGLEFITAFFGCLYAGVIAVPVYPPRRNQNMSRLQTIVFDSQATLALTTTTLLSDIENSWSQDSELALIHLLATDSIPSERDSNWQQPLISSSNLAFLQYTSGSTGTPKGVMVTHANLLHNSNYIKQAFELRSESVSVSWLPSFHDMGLIDGIIQPLYTGFLSILMPPAAFVQQPIRWLQAITHYRATHCGGPDFGYSHCISKVTPEQRKLIDLSSWSSAYSGAEPVRRETLEQFTQMFEPHGFNRRFFYPCYGMAETTLMVSGGLVKHKPVYCDVRADLFAENRVAKTTVDNHNIKQLVGSGRAWLDANIVIVDPELLTRCAPDRIGEIWVSGASVTQGYWNRPEATAETFQAYLQDTGEGPFLRTGDLGFLDNEELFVTGRLKDLIIIRGRNHYPQDIELTVQKSHPALRENCSAAFTLEGGEEGLVIVCEVERAHLRKLNLDEIVTAIKIAISTEHELDCQGIILLKTGSIPKTSSGKIQRRACKAGFLAGDLNIVEQWQKQPQKNIDSLPNSPSISLDRQEQNYSKTVAEIEVWLARKIGEIQELSIESIDLKQPLAVYGLNSVKAVSISAELGEWLGRSVAPTIIYDYPSIQSLAEHLGQPTSPWKSSPVVATSQPETEAIAIVGKGCRLPQANNPEAFWNLLRSGQDAITKIPTSRWHSDRGWGGFLDRVDQFDPQFFNISPREANSIDPQQRLLLEVSWEALENAGLSAEKLTGSRSGVFIGISSGDYAKLAGNLHNTEAYYGTGNALSIAANRLSYFLDWHGPSWAVDTACSSSLVAVHQACQSLLLGECNLALAGGVNLILSPQLTLTFTDAKMMAADGRCKTFDAEADGYVRSEGCGVVVLKRLADALADGDNIQAIIRGSAVNQDGLTNGITAPNGNSQQEVIRLALANAGVKPNQISYVETHGTGTALGDPIEINSLTNVLMEERELNQTCWIGSAKTNIGHLEAAAGIAGLIKVVLSLEHSEIPPHLHLKKLNPYIELARTAIKIPTQLQSWSSVNHRRIAGVSAFGFGGTNAHIILEAAPVESPQLANTQPASPTLHSNSQDLLDRPVHLLTLSAKTAKALQDLVLSYQEHLKNFGKLAIADICFSANTGRTNFNHRLAIVTSDRQELADKLAQISAKVETSNVFCGTLPSNHKSPKIAFLFSGQGSQYVNMGCQLYKTQSIFRQAIDECAELMEPDLEQPLLSILYPEDRDRESNPIDRTSYAQPTLFALEYALFRLWQSWGVVPSALLGHSVGEYVAAVVAGVINLVDGVKLVTTRARLMQSLPSTGEMVSVFATPDEIQKVVTIDGRFLSFAAYNNPQNTVISGGISALTSACDALTNAGIGFKQLRTSHAFHSVLMEPILAQFRQVTAAISYHPPQIPLISNLTGQQIGANEIDAEYWCEHLRQTVKFADGLQTLDKLGIDIFLEIGPKPTLISIGQQCLTARERVWLSSLRFNREDWVEMLDSLARLAVNGAEIDWVGFDLDYARQRISLPTYPFQRKSYWIDAPTETIPLASMRSNENLTFTSQNLFPATVVDMTNQQRQHDILAQLLTSVAKILKADPAEVDVNASFLEMGADSLVLVEAIGYVERTFGIKIGIGQIFDELTTIALLAKYIHEQIPLEVTSPEPVLVTSANGKSATNGNLGQHHESNKLSSTSEVIQSTEAVTMNSTSGLERIMQQQLQVLSNNMSVVAQVSNTTSDIIAQQLSVLREQTGNFEPASNAIKGIDAKKYQPVVSTVNEHRKSPPLQPIADSSRQRSTSQLSPPIDLDRFINSYTQKTFGSKNATQVSRDVLADSRASAGFRPSIKELVYPIIGDRAAGAHFWDIDGNKYIDISMGFGVLLFGHNPQFVKDAISAQMERGLQIGPQAQLAGEVARSIAELTGAERVAFCNSGTEAVMTAIRLARHTTGRHKIVIFTNSYHGHFDGILATASQGQSIPSTTGIAPLSVSDVLVLEYGEDSALEILRANATEIAAAIVEPVQSRNLSLQPREFLQQLRQVTADSGIALVFDEVLLGFRIHQGGAQAWFDIKADLITYGKIIGGGLPIGVVAGRKEYLDGIDGGSWSYGNTSYPSTEKTFFAGTFNKNHLGMAAAHAVLQHLKAVGPSLQTELNQRTLRLVSTLNDFLIGEEVPIKVISFGSLFRFTFSGNFDQFFYHLIAKGIYIWEGRACFLSTAHTDEDINQIVQAIQATVREMRADGFWTRSSSDIAMMPSSDRQATTISSTATVKVEQADEIVCIPLTKAQQQLWFLVQLGDNSSAAYNQSVILQLRGELKLAAMQQAVQTIVDRHEALRTRIDLAGEVQHICPFVKIDVPVIDFSHINDDEQESQLADWLQSDSQTPFDFTQNSLFRCRILKLEAQQHLLVVSAHHIITDGWSMGIILQEIAAIYSAECKNTSSELTSPLQFRSYAQWLAQQAETAAMASHQSYWLEQLYAPIPGLELPTDRPRRATKTFRASRQTIQLEPNLSKDLRRVSREQGCTLFMTMLSAYKTLLHRLTSQDDILIGIPTAGRSLEGSQELIGYCTHLLPIRSQFVDNLSFLEYLRTLRGVLLNAYEHQDYPFANLLNHLSEQRKNNHSPLITATFNLERSLTLPKMSGLDTSLYSGSIGFADYDLSLNVTEVNTKLVLSCDYSTDLFDTETIGRMLGHFQTLLTEIVANPDRQISTLPILTTTEQQQLLFDWNDTAREYPQDKCIHQLFEEQVAKTPDAIAVVFEQEELTYQQLNQRANQLAHYLQTLGVKPEVLVGICVERSLEMVVGLLGIIKAGGAYVPLDPSYPAERLSYMLSDAGIEVLLTQENLLSILPAQVSPVVCLDTNWRVIESHSPEQLGTDISPENLAYVIYTSGSTGQPKGVMNTHQGIRNRLQWMQAAYQLTSKDRVLQKTPFSFDVSVWEFFWPLLTGARIVLAQPEGHKDSNYLINLITAAQITTIHFVPSMLQVFLQEQNVGDCHSLQRVFCSGEALPVELMARFFEHFECEFHNLYGPTEAAIDVTSWQCQPQSDAHLVPIGRPIANTQVYILDSQLQPVPIGVAGELHIGGDGLARGYLNRPELTQAKFIPNPFAPDSSARLYKTGDLTRYLPDGNIEFLGRIDHQVKIRGFRIELGEIEAVLSSHPQIQQAVVIATEDIAQTKQLVAYAVSDEEELSTQQLREFLQQQLPAYMVPSAFIILDTLPLTPNGKVDRKALPTPDGEIDREHEYVAPQTEIEQILTTIWQEVLLRSRISIHDNFFEIGGDSILSIQVVSRAKTAGVQITPKKIFQHQTIAALARVANTNTIVVNTRQDVVIGVAPLTPIQHWFWANHFIAAHHYNQSVLLQTPPDLSSKFITTACQKLLEHHDALRLRFPSADSDYQQINHGLEETVPFFVIDLSTTPIQSQPQALAKIATNIQASLDLSSGPIMQVVLFDLGSNQDGRLLIIIHHLAVDEVSWRILLSDLEVIYQQLTTQQPIQLSPKTTAFIDWAEKLHHYAQSEVLKLELDYWLNQSWERITPIPVDLNSKSADNTIGSTATVSITLSALETHKLLGVVHEAYNTQINDLLLTGLALTLAKWTGNFTTIIDLEGYGREELFEDVDLSRTVGWFTSLFPVLLQLPRSTQPATAIKSIKEQLRTIPQHGLGYGILRYLCTDAGLKERLQSIPTPEISFNYLGQLDRIQSNTGWKIAPEAPGIEQSPLQKRAYMLELNCLTIGGELQIEWNYSSQIHHRNTIEDLAQSYLENIRALIDHCQCTEVGGFTPSDFPEVDFNQTDLDLLLSKINTL